MKNISEVEKRNPRVYEALKKINLALISNYQNVPENGLLTGKAGIILFLFYYHHFFKDTSTSLIPENFLIELFENFNAMQSGPTFCGGAAGIGWLLEHVQQNFHLEINTNDVLEELDKFLFVQMKVMLAKRNYDFLHGAIGIGVYFLSRIVKSNKIKSYLQYLLQGLNKISLKNENGVYWIDTFGEKYGEQFKSSVNLGFAHGLPGIISFLLLVKQEDICPEICDALILNASNFILHQEFENPLLSSFPNRLGEESPSRLGWCYGDLSIGLVINKVAEVYKLDTMKRKSIEILLKTLSRNQIISDVSSADVCLCHGTAGIGHLYTKVGNLTLEKKFFDAGVSWAQATIENVLDPNFNINWQKFNYTLTGPSSARKFTMLEGLAGAGLSLISFFLPAVTNWNKALMLD